MILSVSDRTPLIRTDFSDEDAWSRVAEAAAKPPPDGFRANLHVVDNESFDSTEPVCLAQMAQGRTDLVLLILADKTN